MSFVDDALTTGMAVVIADWLMRRYAARLEQQMADARKLAGIDLLIDDPVEAPTPHQLLGDVARPGRPPRRRLFQ